MTPFPTDSEQRLVADSLRFLDLCEAHCRCPDHWHFLWAALKASGLRRGVHQQRDLFRRLLAEWRPQGGKVLILGAADAGSLEVMDDARGGIPLEFTVVDRCEAPLACCTSFARERGFALHTHRVDVASDALGGPWDLILVHNTLVLMDAAQRNHTLRALRHAIAPGGVVLCNMRYSQALAGDLRPVARDEAASVERAIRRTFAPWPDRLDRLLPMVPVHARAHAESLSMRVDRPAFLGELAATGWTPRAAHSEDSALPSLLSAHNAALCVTTEMLVLVPTEGARS